jgi:phosphoribosylanthranilate isomerase
MRVKICGIRSRADAVTAARAGAAYVGLVFYPPSPRCLTIGDLRFILQGMAEDEATARLAPVALTVDAGDAELDRLVEAGPLAMLQLHGHETPERVAAVRTRYGLPVMKALGVAEEADLAGLPDYESVADQLLIDARPPRDAALPGGNGLAFDWRLIAGRTWRRPWMLAGGLTPENVAEAVRTTGAVQLDVSSGVERAPGRKDPALIERFVRAACEAEADKVAIPRVATSPIDAAARLR